MVLFTIQKTGQGRRFSMDDLTKLRIWRDVRIEGLGYRVVAKNRGIASHTQVLRLVRFLEGVTTTAELKRLVAEHLTEEE